VTKKASGYRFQASEFVCLILALTLAFACLACAGERAGDAHADSGQAGDTESERVGTEVTQAPVQVRASDSPIGAAGQYRHNCRMQIHIFKEDMSKAEVKDFTSRIAYRVQANLNGGGDKNLGDILDEIDVPTYKGLCG
jgi:hypothetical protein